MIRRRALIAWSGGKDSAWALHQVQRQYRHLEPVGLLTTFNAAFDRVAMHAVRRALIERQAEAAGLPLWPVLLPWPCPNEAYEAAMAEAIDRARGEGIEVMIFGDLFLRDIRSYRERQLHGTGIEPVFPLWDLPTAELAMEMITSGLQAVLTCVDPTKIAEGFAGRDFDRRLLVELPASADPCGENGEFHTFVHAGPMFRTPIPCLRGKVVKRDGFVFADLLAGGAPPAKAGQ